MSWLLKSIFAEKLVDDTRIDNDGALFTFDVPSVVMKMMFGNDDSNKVASATCSVFPPTFAFYYQIVAVSIYRRDAHSLYPDDWLVCISCFLFLTM